VDVNVLLYKFILKLLFLLWTFVEPELRFQKTLFRVIKIQFVIVFYLYRAEVLPIVELVSEAVRSTLPISRDFGTLADLFLNTIRD